MRKLCLVRLVGSSKVQSRVLKKTKASAYVAMNTQSLDDVTSVSSDEPFIKWLWGVFFRGIEAVSRM